MATNYKIRLKRFNGTDYDTLNLLSSNIIMNTGNTLQSDVIPSTNGVIKNNNGSFQIATLGTDYGTLAFTITLSSASSSWTAGVEDYTQTVSNVNFIATGFSYVVSPDSSSFNGYANSVIYAENVTTNGQMIFHCSEIPENNLTVNIIRTVTA